MDRVIDEIIREIAAEKGITIKKTDHAVKHFFNWQRQKFIELENETYYWKHFGKFKVMKDRYNKHIENQKTKGNGKEESSEKE